MPRGCRWKMTDKKWIIDDFSTGYTIDKVDFDDIDIDYDISKEIHKNLEKAIAEKLRMNQTVIVPNEHGHTIMYPPDDNINTIATARTGVGALDWHRIADLNLSPQSQRADGTQISYIKGLMAGIQMSCKSLKCEFDLDAVENLTREGADLIIGYLKNIINYKSS